MIVVEKVWVAYGLNLSMTTNQEINTGRVGDHCSLASLLSQIGRLFTAQPNLSHPLQKLAVLTQP